MKFRQTRLQFVDDFTSYRAVYDENFCECNKATRNALWIRRLTDLLRNRTGKVHFIGEISGAEGFGSGVSCRFRVEGGRHWTCLAGLEEGQTHVMHTDFGDEFAPWNHPIDLHYTTKSIQVKHEFTFYILSSTNHAF